MFRRLFRSAAALVAFVSVASPILSIAHPAGASTVSYSASQSFTPPSSSFAGASGGGDGWAIAAFGGNIYNVFHHNSILQLNCHVESTAAACWTGPETITASVLVEKMYSISYLFSYSSA